MADEIFLNIHGRGFDAQSRVISVEGRSPQAKLLVGVSKEIAAQFVKALDRAEREQPLTVEAAMAIAQKHNVQMVA
ncbi:hypothetical protein [Altericista sp. CCNU0014]|uniref:hypothetical protein n=1 Tax=Altericista sp. CCNU0014 TaxID=3082949 RepID=UPI00384ECC38